MVKLDVGDESDVIVPEDACTDHWNVPLPMFDGNCRLVEDVE